MTITVSGSSGVTFPAGGVGNPAGAVVGTTDTQTLTSKTLSGAIWTSPSGSTITSGTSQTAPPPTPQYFDFTGIPSWVKRVTVMFNGVSTNGTSNLQIQIGSGSFTSTGYTSIATFSGVAATATTGFLLTQTNSATSLIHGCISLVAISGNTWVESGTLGQWQGTNSGTSGLSGGTLALGGTLDRVRITTVNGTDTFDAGSINILYE